MADTQTIKSCLEDYRNRSENTGVACVSNKGLLLGAHGTPISNVSHFANITKLGQSLGGESSSPVTIILDTTVGRYSAMADDDMVVVIRSKHATSNSPPGQSPPPAGKK
eukprot:CAMPEP_0194765794 /NCGR_PEP_ID=MMETSP0323_2-20130528/27216_1 /TAXON_ID=2866 ORGANISM="Crypthecodinium cohnii, Strain Seligo" /NCGR_SAMPLE_ID=MMETSP0323_2 /ASSEMBLY_ACC=CAM_ASM_000346 /LENGTH=108 /DNA_ID=CAMNT_0039695921 /DNA_START=27 /DNA_END=353 /DNA_ORIENTATION=-